MSTKSESDEEPMVTGGKHPRDMKEEYSNVYLSCYEDPHQLPYSGSEEEKEEEDLIDDIDAVLAEGGQPEAQSSNLEEYDHGEELQYEHEADQLKKRRVYLEQCLDEAPDLAAFFREFPEYDELMQAKYCRAYANMLAAKSKKNQMRIRTGAPYVRYPRRK